MVVDHELHVSHDFGVAAVSLLTELDDARIISQYSGRLRVKNEWHSQQSLHPFYRAS